MLPDVVVPAVDVPEVLDAAGEPVIEGYTIPEQTVESGCVVRYDAAGGCLGAVRISAVTIPEARIPAGLVPATELPDGEQVAAREFGEVVAPEVTQPAVATPEVCQVRQEDGLPAVTRSGVVREGFSRDGAAREGGTRPEQCGSDGCVPEVVVPAVRIEPVRVPDVDVDPARLDSRRFESRDDVQVVTGDRRVSFVTTGEVLFDFDSTRIRPEGEAALEAIAGAIRARFPRGRLVVEGHTDDRGSAAYNRRLSGQRAEAVARWLTQAGFPRQRLTSRGFGETRPAAPNRSPAQRAANRRVVITVLR